MSDKKVKQKLNSEKENETKVNKKDTQQTNDKHQQGSGIALWLPIGMCLGCSYGLLFDNLAMGMSLGMLWGVAIGVIVDSRRKKNQEGDNDEKEQQEIAQEQVTSENEIRETDENEQDNN